MFAVFEKLALDLFPVDGRRASVAALCLFDHHPEASRAEAKALLHDAGHCHLASVGGHAVALAVDPHGSGAVIHLENTVAESSERLRGLAGNGHFLARIAARVLIDIRNLCSRGTAK